MKITTRITRNLVSLAIILGGVGAVPLCLQGSEPTAQEPAQDRGRITGIVVSCVTGKPIPGAYVGIGDFGDSSGSNYTRHREQGIYAAGETNEDGRFVLEGAALRDDHPLVVTHPEFVRHDQTVALREDEPEVDVRLSLRPAATIHVTVVDGDGNPLQGYDWLLRLEALDGRWFIPAGRDPHLSAFASSAWIEWRDTGSFSFTELDGGEYSIDVIRLVPPENPPPGWGALALGPSGTTYHGGIPRLKIEGAQSRQVRIKPANHQTSVTVKIPEDPYESLSKPELPPFVLISRNPGLLLWDTGKAYGPEDSRQGRLMQCALFCGMVADGDTFTINNLPSGTYSVFAGPLFYMSAAKVEVSRAREVTVEIPPIEMEGMGSVHTWSLRNRVKLEARQYTTHELCELLSAGTDSNPRFVPDPRIRDERLALAPGKARIWDILETLHLDKGWKVEEGEGDTLILQPGASSEPAD